MKNILSIFMIFLFLSTALNGQTFRPNETKIYQSMIGEVYVLSFFVETPEYFWEEEEMEYFYSELEKSQEWLKNQAAEYEQEIVFNNDYFYDNRAVISLDEPYSKRSSRLVAITMEELGYDNFDQLLSRSNFDLKKKKLKLLFFIKGEAYDRSHAYNYWSNSSVDKAIIYCRFQSGMVTNHFVISHEILHQFGAWDLYHGKSQSLEKAQEARALYPNSIMIQTRSKKELIVDELTAWRVGWHYDFKKEYHRFKPVRKDRSRRIRKSSEETTIKFNLKGKEKPQEEKN